MGRVRRMDVGGMVYHALNRANFRSTLFKNDGHYQDFLDLLEESLDFISMRILAYCLMPNHWHIVLYPRADGELAKFMQKPPCGKEDDPEKVPDTFSPVVERARPALRKGRSKETS